MLVVVAQCFEKLAFPHCFVQRVEHQTALNVCHYHVFVVVFVFVQTAVGNVHVVVVVVEYVHVGGVRLYVCQNVLRKGRVVAVVKVQVGEKFHQTFIHPGVFNLIVAHRCVKPLMRRFVYDCFTVGL